MDDKRKLITVLRTVRFVTACAALCAVAAGALGYTDGAQVVGAGLGAGAAIALKFLHVVV